MTKKTLLDDVLTATQLRPGPATWVEQLPKDVQAELEQVKKAYRSRSIEMRKYEIARAIKQSVEQRGYKCIKPAGVVRWLDAN